MSKKSNLKHEFFPLNLSYCPVLHSMKHFFFENHFPGTCLSSLIPAFCCSLSIQNSSDWGQGEICNWKAKMRKHVKKWLIMKSKTKLQKFQHPTKICGLLYPAFCAPGRYILEQGAWLNKSSDTKWKVFSLDGAALNILFWCQIGLPWRWQDLMGLYACVVSVDEDAGAERQAAPDRENWWEVTSKCTVIWRNSVAIEPAH